MNEQSANEPNEKPRILIVDNNSHFARTARLLLDQSGKYVACPVIDPRRALETARSFKPDLVLVDPIMPQQDGAENYWNKWTTDYDYIYVLFTDSSSYENPDPTRLTTVYTGDRFALFRVNPVDTQPGPKVADGRTDLRPAR